MRVTGFFTLKPLAMFQRKLTLKTEHTVFQIRSPEELWRKRGEEGAHPLLQALRKKCLLQTGPVLPRLQPQTASLGKGTGPWVLASFTVAVFTLVPPCPLHL